MATFIINHGYDNERRVEADQHQLSDGYFHFYSDEKGEVFTIKATGVQNIDREGES